MQQYTFSLDYSNRTVTIALNTNAMEGSSIYPVPPEPEPKPDPKPDPVKPDPEQRKEEIEDEVMQGLVLGIIFCVIIFLIVLIIVWIIRCKRKRDLDALSTSLDMTRDEL